MPGFQQEFRDVLKRFEENRVTLVIGDVHDKWVI